MFVYFVISFSQTHAVDVPAWPKTYQAFVIGVLPAVWCQSLQCTTAVLMH